MGTSWRPRGVECAFNRARRRGSPDAVPLLLLLPPSASSSSRLPSSLHSTFFHPAFDRGANSYRRITTRELFHPFKRHGKKLTCPFDSTHAHSRYPHVLYSSPPDNRHNPHTP